MGCDYDFTIGVDIDTPLLLKNDTKLPTCTMSYVTSAHHPKLLCNFL